MQTTIWQGLSSFFKKLKVGNINSGNYSELELDGTYVAKGDATTFDDFTVSSTSTKIGANTKPAFDYTNIGLLFPQNDVSEKIYIGMQMSHSKKLGTPTCLHVHFIQTSTSIPIFNANVRFYNNGDTVPSFTTISTAGQTPVIEYPGSGSILQIVKFPDIDAPANENVSANLDIILYRNDNIVGGTVLVKYIDIHYEKDTLGSRQEYTK